jgi:hypothetical protein
MNSNADEQRLASVDCITVSFRLGYSSAGWLPSRALRFAGITIVTLSIRSGTLNMSDGRG